MRKTYSLLTLSIAVTTSASLATYWVMTNEETAAIAEIFICALAALVTLTNLALPSGPCL